MPKLTKTIVDAVEVPEKGDHYAWDSELPGFGLRVKPSGRRTYVVQYRNAQGRSRRLTIGRHGTITPTKARREAQAMLSDAARGLDPAEERQRQRKAPTLADLAERYMEEHARPKKKPKSVREDDRLWRTYVVPCLGHRKVVDISRADVASLHAAIGKKTPTTANRVMALLSKAFNLAEVWELRPDGSNPCRHVSRFRERKVERYLSSEEVARLGKYLSDAEREGTEMYSVVLALRLLLLTGCRLNEVLKLRWDYVDLRFGRLHLPDSKTGAKTVTLGDEAIAILAQAPREQCNPYVVIGRRKGKHLVNLQGAWQRIRRKLGLEDVRLNDLRHTFATHGVSGGLTLRFVGGLLGHSRPETTARYAHLAPDPLKAAANQISSGLATHMRGRAVAEDLSQQP